jgi:hypothetical protein
MATSAAVKQAAAEGCSGFALAALLFVVALPFGIWAFTVSMPIGSDWWLIGASALVYVPALVVTALLSSRGGRLRSLLFMAVFGTLGSASLGTAAAILLNHWLDGKPREQTTRVLAHREHTARSTTKRYLTLEPWPPLDEPYEIQVEAETYEHYSKAPPPAPIVVYVGAGGLGMPHLILDWGTPKVRIP